MAEQEEEEAPPRQTTAGSSSSFVEEALSGVFDQGQQAILEPSTGDTEKEVPAEVAAEDQFEADALEQLVKRQAGQASSPTAGSNRKSSTASSCGGGSRSSLSSTTRRQRYGKKGSPFAVPPPFDLPVIDQFGFPCAQTNPLTEDLWDARHQLNGSENELKPKGIRDYFSKVQSPKELRRDLKYNPHLSNTQSLLKSMSLPEIDDRKPSFICPDSGPPLVPTRHGFGGNMKDRDGMERLWNDRWHKSIAALNENCHPDHRTYFAQKSLFEESPSQNWRRYLDQEVAHGVWKSVACKKKEKFPPMGGRLRGRSGAPVPGASP